MFVSTRMMMMIEKEMALTRVEEVDTGDDEGVDDREDNVGLISDGLESDRGNHDDHAEVELAQMHGRETKDELTS
jgi:hypothetical protein